LVGDEYSFLEEYKGVDVKVSVKHNECGHTYKVSPYKFIKREQRCPRCNESKGERRIREFLLMNNVNYKEKYIFDDCKMKLPLRFDFAIFKHDELITLIEYDGRQHFEAEEFYGGKKALKLYKKRDEIKNKYCSDNKLNLLRIPYTEYEKIEEILATHL